MRRSWNKGKRGVFSKETLLKMSLAKKGKTSNFKGKKHTSSARVKMKESALKRWMRPEYRDMMTEKHIGPRPDLRGQNHPNWRGGLVDPRKKFRFSTEYKFWRTSVFERDDYTCQECHVKGGTLNADHIKPFALFPELRLDINNGRTLCVACHRKTPTYGRLSRKDIATH